MSNVFKHDHIVFQLDESFRNPVVSRWVLDTPNMKLYKELDVNLLVEYSRRLYVKVIEAFRLSVDEQQSMRIASCIVTIKFFTDISLHKPYTFAWSILAVTGEIFYTDLEPFLRRVRYFEEVLLDFKIDF